jgi:predicted Zn-dependent peptidase
VLQLGAGLDSSKTVEAYTRMREIVAELAADGPTREEVDRARAYAAGRLVLAFENSGAVARHVATQAIVRRETVDPDAAISALDDVTFEEVAGIARSIDPETLAVACVGPHTVDDF